MCYLAINGILDCIAGKNLSEDQVEAMIESDDPQIFTQDVSCRQQ